MAEKGPHAFAFIQRACAERFDQLGRDRFGGSFPKPIRDGEAGGYTTQAVLPRTAIFVTYLLL